MKLLFVVALFTLSLAPCVQAEEAFGAPGSVPSWSSAKKVHTGTFYEPRGQVHSPLWFTLAHGVLTEVYFPRVDTAQMRDSQLLLIGPNRRFYEERTQLKHLVVRQSPSQVELVNSTPDGNVVITHRYFTMGTAPILVNKITIDVKQDGWSFYQLVNPQLDNTGYHDTAQLTPQGFAVQDGSTFMEVESTCGFEQRSVGFVGRSDGHTDMVNDAQMDYQFTRASNGNVALTGKLALPPVAGRHECQIIYSFQAASFKPMGKPMAQQSGNVDLQEGEQKFEQSWQRYLSQTKTPTLYNAAELYLYQRSLVTLKTHEDKLNPGALVASLSIPWGEKQFEHQGSSIGGYHLIWPRDLFHISLALLLSGDQQTPLQALEYLARVQYKEGSGRWEYGPRMLEKNGAWPQNTWVNGREYWSGLQIDQVGYPIQLYYHVYRRQPELRAHLTQELSPMLERAMDFILTNGPWTAQERWEENFGISPSSFAAATAGLLMAAKINPQSARAQDAERIARQWLEKPGDNIDTWTFTHKGVLDGGQYYLRVAGCSTFDAWWNPEDQATCHLANSSRRLLPSAFIDQGFLQLALLGLKRADDWRLLKSLDVVNNHIRVKTPKGYAWYRYAHDAYGEEGKGRLWPLLAGEQGRFALERLRAGNLSEREARAQVQAVIDSYLAIANDGGMLPEQIFEDSGEGTGAATPLAWTHAEYVKLLWSRHHMKNVENPF